MNPMSGLLRLSSVVPLLRQPQIWVTELTDQAMCQTTTVGNAPAQKAFGVHGGMTGWRRAIILEASGQVAVPMLAAGQLVIQFLTSEANHATRRFPNRRAPAAI
jgi:hypothetical protein